MKKLELTALINTRSSRVDQTRMIERRIDHAEQVIVRWQPFDTAELGVDGPGIDGLKTPDGLAGTLIVADAGQLLVNQCASAVLVMIEQWLGQGVTLWFANTGEQLNTGHCADPGRLLRVVADSLQVSRLTLERQRKAKAAAQRRKQAGLRNGRTPGAVVRSKLDPSAGLIKRELRKGTSKTRIAQRCGVSRSTLQAWLKRQDS